MKFLFIFISFCIIVLSKSTSESLIIGGVEILKGSKTTINIELSKLYTTPTQLPVRVIRGEEDGPVVFVCAAIHGDELNGIEIIRRLRKLEVLDELRGTLILIPMLNVYGVMTLSRYFPDRRDLNRHFPGHPEGSLASRVADTFMREVVLKSDLGIDLHTASIHKVNLPQVRTDIKNQYTLELAKSFGAPVVIHSKFINGSLRKVAGKEGVPVLVYEAGEALRLNEKSIRVGVKGILNVLIANGMLPNSVQQEYTKAPLVLKQSRWLRAMTSGLMSSVKKLGDEVQKGEIIAYINDPLVDDVSFEVLAPYDGIIIGKSKLPLVQEGDALFHIAYMKKNRLKYKMKPYYCGETIEECEYIDSINEENK